LICGYEGPQAVPARPYGKGRFSEGKAFGSGKGRMKIGARGAGTLFVNNF
jgi:hypothetical protein